MVAVGGETSATQGKARKVSDQGAISDGQTDDRRGGERQRLYMVTAVEERAYRGGRAFNSSLATEMMNEGGKEVARR